MNDGWQKVLLLLLTVALGASLTIGASYIAQIARTGYANTQLIEALQDKIAVIALEQSKRTSILAYLQDNMRDHATGRPEIEKRITRLELLNEQLAKAVDKLERLEVLLRRANGPPHSPGGAP